MTRTRPHPDRSPGTLEHWWLALVTASATVLVMLVWVTGNIADTLTGHPQWSNPAAYLLELGLGRRHYTILATCLLATTLALAATAAVLVIRRFRHRRRLPTQARIADAAARLAHPDELAALSPRGVATSAARLRPGGVDPQDPTQHGRLIGVTHRGGIPLRSSWEELGVHIWGPRRGKTTTQTIPAVCEAPGPVVATSNKRDLLDATRGVREDRGDIWVFDPQSVADTPQTFWYNPLSRIDNIRDAEILVGHFVAGTESADAKRDAYFDTAKISLASAYLYAAARAGRSLSEVYQWVANDRLREPLNLLTNLGETLLARDVSSILFAPDKQRAGVFDSAKALLRCLRDPNVLAWVTPPPPSSSLPEFRPAEFVNSTDTLYPLSQEGPGSAAPLTAAITEHVSNAAITEARTRPSGRLDPPMYQSLDEAANTVRWAELPNLFSHLGSRGILVDMILQSWAQGEEAWGRGGMEKLWNAANIRVYGGGNLDGPGSAFLKTLADDIGPQDTEFWSLSLDPFGRRTRSTSSRDKHVLPQDLLAALPTGTVLLLASGAPPALLKTVPWWDGPHAGAIRYSLARYDPGAPTTP